MIIDSLAHAGHYAAMGPRFARAFEWLAGRDLATLTTGDYPIDGDHVVARVREYTTLPAEAVRWEAHRRFADIQLVLAGEERFGWAGRDSAEAPAAVLEPYDPKADVGFFSAEGTDLALQSGWFILVLPNELHRPGAILGTAQTVRKLVVKVEM